MSVDSLFTVYQVYQSEQTRMILNRKDSVQCSRGKKRSTANPIEQAPVATGVTGHKDSPHRRTFASVDISKALISRYFCVFDRITLRVALPYSLRLTRAA